MHTILRVACFLGLASVFLLTGCTSSFTYKVWHTGEFRHVREPAANPALAVFFEPQRKDFLVAYDSVLDGGDDPRRLNYFLGENERPVAERRKPHFTSTNGSVMIAVPVNGPTNNRPVAIWDKDPAKELTIYTDAGGIGPYPLPVFEETNGNGVRVLLTPWAVVGDAACVSAILGLFAVFACPGCFSSH